MSPSRPSDITPARVLLFLRDAGPHTGGSLARHFAIPPGLSPAFAHYNRLSDVLRRLEGSGLIRRDGPPMDWKSIGSLEGLASQTHWSVTSALTNLQDALELSLTGLVSAQEPPSDSSAALQRVRDRVAEALPEDRVYREDFIASLVEMRFCMDHGCFIAVLGLAGKCLEIAIKHRLSEAGVEFEDDWMLGKLLSKLKESQAHYVDPALTNIANIINQSRIPAVHAKRTVPIPSREQAAMVVHAVVDFLNRTLVSSVPH